MKIHLRLSLLTLIVSLLFSHHTLANEPTTPQIHWQSVNQTIIDQHIIPRYLQMADSGAKLSQQAQRFCAATDNESFEALRLAYHHAMDDWMGIQHIRFGPVELFLQYNRLQLWPDKHNTGSKQIRQVLSQKPHDILDAERFALSSVAIQGFTALERLLYPSTPHPNAFGGAGQPTYRCELLMAITRNIADIATNVHRDWRGGKVGFRDVVLSADHGNDYFDSSQEVSARLLSNLSTQLQSIVDQKLMLPLEHRKMELAESWRSRRSLRNIQLNLQALEDLYSTGFSGSVTDAKLDAEIRQSFRDAITSLEAIHLPLYRIQANTEADQKLQHVLESCRRLKRLINNQLPPTIGMTLGFNSLDGD